MGRLYLQIALVAFLSAITSGCALVSDLIYGGDTPIDPSAEAEARYFDGIPRIRPGVAIIVQVGAATIAPVKMEIQVDQNGMATFQYLLKEPIPCDGLTLDEFKKKALEAYAVYIKEPNITATFAAIPEGKGGVSPWGTVMVLGDVAAPGPVNMPATMNLTVTKVLMMAGGLRPFADKRRVRVTSCDKNGNKTRRTVDLVEIGEKGLIDKDIRLRAGDVVWVPQTAW